MYVRRGKLRWGQSVAALIVALAIAGCGGASSTGTSPSATTPETTATEAQTGPTTDSETTATTPPTTTAETTTENHREPPAATGTARALLAELAVKGRAPKTGYSRAQFGDGWATVGGCDMRERILVRDLTQKTYKAGSNCRVQSGTLRDPYTARTVRYVRGGVSEVDIDHVVALADAWQKGAQQWSASKRATFANDPLELLAVSAEANRAKGDGDAATWLPSNKRFRCRYVSRQIAVKHKYGLWVTAAERDAMTRVLAGCPGERVPSAGSVPAPSVPANPEPPPRSTTPASPAPGSPGSGRGRFFANCAAVRAAGLAPLRRGTPDYEANPRLDRDKDGLACE